MRDLNILSTESLPSPRELEEMFPLSEKVKEEIEISRNIVKDIISGKDKRLLAVVGPCSISDRDSAIDYAERLKKLSEKVKDVFYIVMRTYFEKPRTNIGWRGFITDPDMDNSGNIKKGLIESRKLLINITSLSLPVGFECLDTIIPQYTDDFPSWASVGARTSESQLHRSLSSGLSIAVGFKNSTSGDTDAAINAILSSRSPSSFIGINRDGKIEEYRTKGNKDTHLILRGGSNGPNYYDDDIEEAGNKMIKKGINPSIIVDCSHQNSGKDYKKQKRVLHSVIEQVRYSSQFIKGFMLESNINEGRQDITENIKNLKYGVSVTDGCLGWSESEEIILKSAEELRGGRLV